MYSVENQLMLFPAALFLVVCLFPISITADDSSGTSQPSALIELAPGGNTYVFLVSKSESRLNVYRSSGDGSFKLVTSIKSTTGLNGGDKQREGDQRTPEGIYYFVRIRENDELLDEYGIRAFDMNYPNKLDLLAGKQGSGIWLHATDEPERLLEPRSTRGCVVVSNEDIKRLSDYITLFKTPIVISEKFNSCSSGKLRESRKQVRAFIQNWLDAWSRQDFEQYSNCYSSEFRGGGRRMKSWLRRKKTVFQATRWAKIEVSDLSILRSGSSYVVNFYQRYRSNLMDDTGLKWVYLVNADSKLKIVEEEWHHVSHALHGGNWNVSRPMLSRVVSDQEALKIEKSGKLALVDPQISVPRVEQAESVAKREEAPASPVEVQDLALSDTGSENIVVSFKLTNVISQGNKQRGRLFVVAEWEGNLFSTFPQAQLRAGIPVMPKEGDTFGIRWFKIVNAEIKKPRRDAKLLELRCFAYSWDGELLLDEIVWKKVSEEEACVR